MPLSVHTGWMAAPDRPDPVALLEEQNSTRVPDLVPVRHGRMLVSPFTFYRGAAKIMAADLKDTPTAGLNVQLCGDAHLSNFGAFASPERTLLFDLNDFDETLPRPFEYDVKRMAASFTIVARNNSFNRSHARATNVCVDRRLSNANGGICRDGGISWALQIRMLKVSQTWPNCLACGFEFYDTTSISRGGYYSILGKLYSYKLTFLSKTSLIACRRLEINHGGILIQQ